jgi:hypothetical protein
MEDTKEKFKVGDKVLVSSTILIEAQYESAVIKEIKKFNNQHIFFIVETLSQTNRTVLPFQLQLLSPVLEILYNIEEQWT